MDHRINAENSIDLSDADFEFYKKDAADVDNAGITKYDQDLPNIWKRLADRIKKRCACTGRF